MGARWDEMLCTDEHRFSLAESCVETCKVQTSQTVQRSSTVSSGHCVFALPTHFLKTNSQLWACL